MTRTFPALVAMLLLAGTPAAGQSVDQAPAELHPTPAHTGWSSLAKDTAQDFVAFPRRKSTWVLLGAGAAGALLAHQADAYVQEHIVGNSTAEKIFAPGKVIGSAYVQIGASVGLWAVGRYIVPGEGEPKTNKWSHIGFDLMRAQIVTQTFTQAMKIRFAAIGRPASAARFPPAMRAARLPRPRCSSGTSATADRGLHCSAPRISPRRASSTIATF